jgi:hypothetical protein
MNNSNGLDAYNNIIPQASFCRARKMTNQQYIELVISIEHELTQQFLDNLFKTYMIDAHFHMAPCMMSGNDNTYSYIMKIYKNPNLMAYNEVDMYSICNKIAREINTSYPESKFRILDVDSYTELEYVDLSDNTD